MTLLTLLSICDSFTVVTMTLLTVTEYVWQFYGRHRDFVNRCWVFDSFTVVTMTVNRYWVFMTVLLSSPWLC